MDMSMGCISHFGCVHPEDIGILNLHATNESIYGSLSSIGES